MDYSKVHVLVTDGGARQTLTVIRGLKEAGCKISVLCSSKLDACYASNIPDEKILSEDAAGSYEGFERFLLGLLQTGKYDVLLPVAELTTNKVTSHEDEYKKYVKLACAPRSAYIQAFNKQATFEQAMRLGLPCPYTRTEDQSVEDYLTKASFPVIIKPRNGVGSIGFHKFDTAEEFRAFVQERKIDLNDYVVQEYVYFKKRLGILLLVDQEGKAATSYATEVLREYPVDAGTAVLVRSVDEPEAIRDATALLRAMGWRGFADVGFMVDEKTGERKLMEINGRIPASFKMSWLCGINVAKQLIELAYDEPVTAFPENKVFGVMTRHTQADWTWFLKSPDRFRTKPSWFSRKNRYDVLYWKDDPKPWFAYTLQRFFRFREIEKKKRH